MSDNQTAMVAAFIVNGEVSVFGYPHGCPMRVSMEAEKSDKENILDAVKLWLDRNEVEYNYIQDTGDQFRVSVR